MGYIDEFDEKTATIRVLLYLYENPNSGITKVIKEAGAGQKAVYSAIEFLMKCGLIMKSRSSSFPYNPLFSLTDRGASVAKHLVEIRKILENKEDE